jgi:hypothetical protein
MTRNLFALAWLALGLGWGWWAYERLRAMRGRTRAGSFLAHGARMALWGLGVGGMLVLGGDGWQRGGGPSHRWRWPDALALAAAGGLFGGLLGLVPNPRAEALAEAADALDAEPFGGDYEAEVLAAEGRASADECRRMARRLVTESRRRGRPLPAGLQAFVGRHRPRGA